MAVQSLLKWLIAAEEALFTALSWGVTGVLVLFVLRVLYLFVITW